MSDSGLAYFDTLRYTAGAANYMAKGQKELVDM
jgi:hypothetical protein